MAKIFARKVARKIYNYHQQPYETQTNVFHNLISAASHTQFGKNHGFSEIRTYEDFRKNVPLFDYEKLKPYIEKIIAGENGVLWPGKPIYFCKTSGTTSGTKYIPITSESIKNQINAARNALLLYINETQNSKFVNGKMIFLQGSPKLTDTNGIPTGRLSGIVAHHVPSYLQKNRLPSYETNCIEDWETKVDAIVKETVNENMTLISGIPPWVQMYFDKLLEYSRKKTIGDLFPNFELFVYGGVNFEPYRSYFEKTIGKKIAGIETYPASEGFIAYQDSQVNKGLLLNIHDGIFYEFIEAEKYLAGNYERISVKDIELNKNYVIVLNTNAGLWGYVIGDTVKFVSKKPLRLIVTGRIKHFISAFGEHVIAEEVDYVMEQAIKKFGLAVTEYHVAPQVNPPNQEPPFHEWFIEFAEIPENISEIAAFMDNILQQKNSYYKDLREGKMLQNLKISTVKKDAFKNYMKSQGKLGGQHKVPRLTNDRKFAEGLKTYLKK